MQTEDKGRLLYVLADGLLREQVEETSEGAKLRIIKNDDGTEKMRKWEYTYPGISGFITSVTTRDGDYGTSILISIKDSNDEQFTLALQAKSKYGEDFIHKLPNISLAKEVSIKPYNFTDGDRKVAGVTITQDGEKVGNAFNWKEDDEWKSLDGYPQVDEKKTPKNSDQWMIFFTQRREWVLDYLTEKGLITEATGTDADIIEEVTTNGDEKPF
jgi:hypothetical protein